LFLNQLNINICIATFVALLLGEYKGVCNLSLTGEKSVILPVKPGSNLVLNCQVFKYRLLGINTYAYTQHYYCIQ